jgi:hypothetical protein
MFSRISIMAREGIEPPTRGFSVLERAKHPTSPDHAGVVDAALGRQGVVFCSPQLSGLRSQVRTQVPRPTPPFQCSTAGACVNAWSSPPAPTSGRMFGSGVPPVHEQRRGVRLEKSTSTAGRNIGGWGSPRSRRHATPDLRAHLGEHHASDEIAHCRGRGAVREGMGGNAVGKHGGGRAPTRWQTRVLPRQMWRHAGPTLTVS